MIAKTKLDWTDTALFEAQEEEAHRTQPSFSNEWVNIAKPTISSARYVHCILWVRKIMVRAL